jgi:carbamate kinase
VLAREIDAELLLILTDVDAVYRDYGSPQREPIRRLSVAQAETLLASGQLGEGSMAPKVEASIQFLRAGGRRAVIARLDQGREAVDGEAGTEINL